MKPMYLILLSCLLGTASASRAQSLDDLNIQFHGYATQGFLYSSNNNFLTTNSSDGSPAWTEAVVNLSSQPMPKLRIGVQARYSLLGNLGNAITLDWAAADYKVSDKFGIRFGKVKTPSGLYNDIQDIDPSYIWALLPQSIYPITSRNAILAHYGAVAYGTLQLGSAFGKLEYRGWAGERVIPGTDGYFLSQTEAGLTLPNGINGITYGAALHWKTPLHGLMVGASAAKDNRWIAPLTAGGGALTGNETLNPFGIPTFFANYEKGKASFSLEDTRLALTGQTQLGPYPASPFRVDTRSWYAMGSYKITDKLTCGLYDSQSFNHQAALGPARYQKDWALAGRYDLNQFLYAKIEQHFIDGTALGYDADTNPNGLKPNSRLTVLKAGVSF